MTLRISEISSFATTQIFQTATPENLERLRQKGKKVGTADASERNDFGQRFECAIMRMHDAAF